MSTRPCSCAVLSTQSRLNTRKSITGGIADKTGVMGTYNRGLTNLKQRHEEMVRKGHHDSNDATKAWALSLNLDPKSGDIMAGWKWDLAVKPDGFVLVVAAIPAEQGDKVAVYATDEEWVMYRADLAEVPKASLLLHAQWLSEA
jgi:hypothetical protein